MQSADANSNNNGRKDLLEVQTHHRYNQMSKVMGAHQDVVVVALLGRHMWKVGRGVSMSLPCLS